MGSIIKLKPFLKAKRKERVAAWKRSRGYCELCGAEGEFIDPVHKADLILRHRLSAPSGQIVLCLECHAGKQGVDVELFGTR